MQETRICQNCKKEFQIEPEDFEFYKRIDVPPPTWCPECRMIRRMVWRNERALYKRKCDLCGKDIIGMYPKSSDFTVYCTNCWFSDKWDPLSYGKYYNFYEPFFNQWENILYNIPLYNLYILESGGGNFVSYSINNKNCYLSTSILGCENVMFSSYIDYSKDSYDSIHLSHAELCYENIDCNKNFKTLFVIQSRECSDSMFLFNCVNCVNCFMSYNLRNKQYVFRNKQYSKEKYFEEIKNIYSNLGSYTNLQNLYKEFTNLIMFNAIHKYANINKSQNAMGDNILNSKNIYYGFGCRDLENSKYIARAFGGRDIYDGYGAAGELVYDGFASGLKPYNELFYFLNNDVFNIVYSAYCYNSSHLFGCVGLRNKEYCILNKQYTKDEYFKMVEKIKQHMNDMPYIDSQGRVYRYGEFFPPELSPFAYNETIAQEYFPKTKEEALAQGYRWKDREERNIKPDLYTKDLPDHIKDVDNSIIGKIIQCAHSKINPDGTLEEGCNQMCTTAFKIIEPELEFYKRMNLPLPRLCPNCRHFERLKQRNPLKLWKRKCQCQGNIGQNPNNPNTYQNQTTHFHGNSPCPNEFQTSYSPDRPEIIYCEECYNSEVA